MRFCGACGAQAGPTLRFCTSCGANLLPAAPGAAPDPVFAYPAPAAPWPSAVPPPASGADSVFAAPPVPAVWTPEPVEASRRPLVVVAAALAGLLVVGGGYLVTDRLLLAEDTSTAAQGAPLTPEPDLVDGAGAVDVGVEGEATPEGSGAGATPAQSAGTDELRPHAATATCQAPPGTDAAGAPVTYDPTNTLDGVGSTAWRCAGSAVGEQLVFDFGRPVVLASVGLVPGYDKTDPVDGTDRFAENRTVTAVTWRFDGGAAHRQDIAVPSRAMAQARLSAPVTTTRVVLEITGTGNDSAIRDFTTISDVAFTGSR